MSTGSGDSPQVEQLLERMTTREKVGQLNQRLLGWECVVRQGKGYRLTDHFTEELDRWGGLGALYGLFRADAWSGRTWENGIPPEDRAEVAALVDTAVREASPHGVPALIVEEAPHGHQALGGTLLPTNLAVGATWDPATYREAARAVAAELSASGVHLALVSALDILRDPRWGRCEECFGEDPLLAAEFTRALVEGMQGKGRCRLRAGGVGVTLKHFAAQGEAFGGRNGQSAVLGPHDLAEIHLPAAKAGIDAGAVAVMAAYTDIDGVPCCANRALLGDLLRDQWGFDGIVMADGKAIDRLVTMTGTPAAAARIAVTSGVDLSLWDEAYMLLPRIAMNDAQVHAAVDRSVRRVLRLKDRLGLLDSPQSPGPRASASRQSREQEIITLSSRTRALAAGLAERGLVLLDNGDRVLPIAQRETCRIAVLGPHADDPTAPLGDYVPPLAPDGGRTVLAALRDQCRGWAEVRGLASEEPGVFPAGGEEMSALLSWAEVVVTVLGGTSHRCYDDLFADNGATLIPTRGSDSIRATCGEGLDVADLQLSYGQDAWLKRVRAGTSQPVIAVVIAGRPPVLTEVLALADATVWAGYPGPGGADAIARLLVGEIEPTGRLPFTLPRSTGVVPLRYNDRHSAAGAYIDQPDPVLRPFGFGLGYRTATVTSLLATVGAQTVTVTVLVCNDSSAPLTDTVQIFARRWGGGLWPRLRELLAFRRVELPGETEIAIEVTLPVSDAFVETSGAAIARTTLYCGGRETTIRPLVR